MVAFYAGNATMCRYVDLPLQHISDPVLGRMRRATTKAKTLDLSKDFEPVVETFQESLRNATQLVTGEVIPSVDTESTERSPRCGNHQRHPPRG